MKQTLNLEQKALKFKDFEVLSEQELRETEGGLLAEILIGIAIAATVEIMSDWKNFKAGLMGKQYIQ